MGNIEPKSCVDTSTSRVHVKERCLLLVLRIRSTRLEILGSVLSVVLTNTGIFLRGFKLCGESRT